MESNLRRRQELNTEKLLLQQVWGHEEFEAAKKNYYVDRLRLTENGLPPREGLQRLGLDFVIPVLEPMGAIG